MIRVFLVFASLFLGTFSFAGDVSDIVITDSRSIYDILVDKPQLQAQVTSRGLVFHFTPVVTEVVIKFIDVGQDPEWPECRVRYTLSLGNLVNNQVVDLPFMAGLRAPTVASTQVGDCAMIKEQEFSE